MTAPVARPTVPPIPAPVARPLGQLHSPHTADPDAPVVVRFAAVGDVVLLTVLLAALAERHGRPVHVLGAGEWTPVLLAHDPAVSELRMISSRRSPYWLTPSRWAAARWLAAHRGPVYHCERDVYGERFIQRAGVPEDRMIRAWNHYPGDTIHWADWWLQIAAMDPAGLPPAPHALSVPPRPRLAMGPQVAAETAAWLAAQGLAGHPVVLIQPGHKKTYKRGRIGTAGHDKHWPAEHWGAVIRGVWQGLPNAAVLVCGSKREAGLAQAVVDAAGPPPPGGRIANNAALKPTLERLMGLAAMAHGMITVDTGPAHVAGAMDCSLVVLYGQAGWGRWKPRAATSDVVTLGPHWPTDGARVEDLSPAQVIAAWQGLRPRNRA